MSSLACEAHIIVDGPAPVERIHTLLTAPGVLVDKEEHWESGVILRGYPDSVPTFWQDNLAGTFRVKDIGDADFPQGEFEPVTLYVPVSCTASGMSADEFAEKSGRVLQVTQAYGVEKALAQGVPGLSNPYMGDTNLTILASGVSARVGLSYLEEAIGGTARGGMIHVTPAVADALQPIRITNSATEPLYTGAGTPIVIGAGYEDTVPDGQAAPATTRDFIFATGPVQVRIDDEVTLPNIGEALDRVMNDVVYRAEKVALVSWDTSLQVGVLVDWAI